MSDEHDTEQANQIQNFGPEVIQEEEITMKEVIRNLAPHIGSTLLNYFIKFIETHFLGETKDMSLFNGVALGSTYNLFFTVITSGFGDALEIILPRNFAMKKYDVLGRLTNQSRIILCIFFLLYVTFTLIFSSSILTLLGNEDDSNYIEIAEKFVLYTIPHIFLDSQNEIMVKYSESHLYYTPIIASMALAGVTHVLGCFFLINYFKLGVVGSALAINITYSVRFIYLFVHLKFFNPYPESFTWIDKNIFVDFTSTLKISVITMVTMFSQYNFFTITQLIANKLSKVSYAKYIVLSNCTYIFYSFIYAVMDTICLLVSIYIGKNSTKDIKKTINYLIILSAILYCGTGLFIYLLRYYLYEFFNANPMVYSTIDIQGKLTYYMLFENLLVLIGTFEMAILRSCEIYDYSSIFLFTMLLIYHGFNSTMNTSVLKYDLDGLYLSYFFILIILIFIWTIYLVFKLDFKLVCLNYSNEQMSLQKEEESLKFINLSRDETVDDSNSN
jgi:Na+-driven multidrug efflux pump